MAVEEGVARGQELDLARGVPPGQDQGILACVFVDGGCQGGQFIEFAVNGGDAVRWCGSPSENEYGRSLAAPGGVARGQRLFDVLRQRLHIGQW